MGLFDKVKKTVQDQVEKHPDQVEKLSDQAIAKAGDAVDKATGGQHAGQVDKAQTMADDTIGDKGAGSHGGR